MNKYEKLARFKMENKLSNLGFSFSEIQQLRRISMQLRSWYEKECGDDSGWIERNPETDKPYFHSHTGRKWAIPDREKGAEKRLIALMANHPTMDFYLQTDPRGYCLHILRPGDVPEGKSKSSFYTNGIAVF